MHFSGAPKQKLSLFKFILLLNHCYKENTVTWMISVLKPFWKAPLKWVTISFLFTFVGLIWYGYSLNKSDYSGDFMSAIINIATGLFTSLVIIGIIDIKRIKAEEIGQRLTNLKSDQVYIENQINNLWLMILTYNEEEYLYFNHSELHQKKVKRDSILKQMLVNQIHERVFYYMSDFNTKNYYEQNFDGRLFLKAKPIIHFLESMNVKPIIEISDILGCINLLTDFNKELKVLEPLILAHS
jgi:hypothetical protein